MNQNHSKKRKIIRIVMIFLLFVLIITYIGYSYYMKNNGKEALKNQFFSKIKNHDFAFFIEQPIYEKMIDKLEQENYEANTNIKMATTMENNMFSELDLSKFALSHQLRKNNHDNKAYNRVDLKYSSNPLLSLDFISNREQFAVKSDEIVNKYVGINKQNTQEIVNQLSEKEVDLVAEKKWKNFLVDREPIHLSQLTKASHLAVYANICKENISKGTFSRKENVILTLDSEQVATTEYTVQLDSIQTNELWKQLSEELEKDEDFVSELVVSKVDNWENETDGILEYTDNDTISEVQGEENNFNTSINIWGENTAAENTITENTTNEVNVENNTVQNNVVTNATVENTVPISNSVQINNTTENETNTVDDSNSQEPEQPVEQPVQNLTEQIPEPVNNNVVTQNVIQEEDNVRRQGFIGVNEETQNEEDENFIVGENYEETVKNIEKLANKINWSSYLLSGAKANCSQEELVEMLQGILNEKAKEKNRLQIKLYVSEERVVKLNFELLETEESLDFEVVSKAEDEKYLVVTVLKGKETSANGYKVSFYQKKDDAVTKTKVNIHKIQKNKISQKTNLDLETKGTLNSKKFGTTCHMDYSNKDGEFKMDLENSLNFDANIEIEDLNGENCLLIDTISNEELLLTRDAIKEKTKEVLREKNRNLNIIDISNSSLIVQQTEQPSVNPENEAAKQQVKDVLIQTLRDKMREYLDQGTNLTIEDLEDLAIPDYEVQVSISSNLAIITVNGYRFSLDSEFNLSDS